MNFYPDWLKDARERNQKQFKLLLLVLVILALVHYFFITGKQKELEGKQNSLTESLAVNEEQLIASQGLSQELKLLSDRLKEKKILFTAENTQIIIEAINDLLISSGAQMVEVSLNNDRLTNSNYLNSAIALDEPIGVRARFRVNSLKQFEIIDQVIQSQYLFAINQINQDQDGMINWQIGIPTRKKEDVNENNLRQISKVGIFPNINLIEPVEVIEPVVVIPNQNQVNSNCNLPNLEGIVYRGDDSLIFINGEMVRLNAKINCYQISAIFAQKVQLTDPNGVITELFTKPNE